MLKKVKDATVLDSIEDAYTLSKKLGEGATAIVMVS